MPEQPKNSDQKAELARILEDLPSLPTVATRLMTLDRESDRVFEELVELLESDPSFALRSLRLANSSASAPASPIETLQATVARLGTNTIVDRLTTMAVQEALPATNPEQEALWHHSLQVAFAARRLAHETGAVAPELAYLVGLLHDIGRFVVSVRRAEPDAEGAAVDPGSPATPDLGASAAIDHAELGWHVCEVWGIPEVLATVIRHHHTDLVAAKRAFGPVESALLALVQVADRMSRLVLEDRRFRAAGALLQQAVLARRCQPVGHRLEGPLLLSICRGMLEESDEAMRAFGFRVADGESAGALDEAG